MSPGTCVIVNDYGTPTFQQKVNSCGRLRSKKLPAAVRNNCIIISLSYDEVIPGPRNAEALLALAKLLHPTALGQSARS
jgi:hypothetical protein